MFSFSWVDVTREVLLWLVSVCLFSKSVKGKRDIVLLIFILLYNVPHPHTDCSYAPVFPKLSSSQLLNSYGQLHLFFLSSEREQLPLFTNVMSYIQYYKQYVVLM